MHLIQDIQDLYTDNYKVAQSNHKALFRENKYQNEKIYHIYEVEDSMWMPVLSKWHTKSAEPKLIPAGICQWQADSKIFMNMQKTWNNQSNLEGQY